MNKGTANGVRPPQKNDRPKTAESQDQKAPARQGQNPQKRGNFFKNRRPNNQQPTNLGQHTTNSGGPLARKYEHFMEMYLNTRRKFFSVFFSDDKKQREKSERTYVAAAQSLREFEHGLSDEGKKSLQNYLNEGKEDNSYSKMLAERGELEKWEEERQQIPEMADPHTLSAQRANNFAHDTEETIADPEEIKSFAKTK